MKNAHPVNYQEKPSHYEKRVRATLKQSKNLERYSNTVLLGALEKIRDLHPGPALEWRSLAKKHFKRLDAHQRQSKRHLFKAVWHEMSTSLSLSTAILLPLLFVAALLGFGGMFGPIGFFVASAIAAFFTIMGSFFLLSYFSQLYDTQYRKTAAFDQAFELLIALNNNDDLKAAQEIVTNFIDTYQGVDKDKTKDLIATLKHVLSALPTEKAEKIGPILRGSVVWRSYTNTKFELSKGIIVCPHAIDHIALLDISPYVPLAEVPAYAPPGLKASSTNSDSTLRTSVSP